MAFNVIISDNADQQITEAFLWYEERGKGSEFMDELYKILNLIERNPMLFPIDFDEYRKATVKRFPYLVIYFTANNDVVVTSVFHTSRNPRNKIP